MIFGHRLHILPLLSPSVDAAAELSAAAAAVATMVNAREKSKSSTRLSSAGSSSNNDGARWSTDNQKAHADRYLHRKVDIFQTIEEDLAEMGIVLSKNSGGTQQQAGGKRGGGNSGGEGE